MKYLILLLLLSSCGNQGDDDVMVRKVTKKKDVVVTVSSILKPYAQSFQSIMGVDTTKISLAFVKQDTRTRLAVCWIYPDSTERDIEVDPTWWNGATPSAREQVMYHELGHCAMGIMHRDGHDVNHLPLSIMRSWAFDDDELDNYELHHDEYMNELKH